MKRITLLLTAVLVFGTTVFAASDDNKKASHDIKVGIPTHSLVGLSSTEMISLQPVAPDAAGEGLSFDTESATNSSVWLNYSSIVGKASNTISVSMKGQNLPKGVTIELVAAEDAGKGKGKIGNAKKKAIVLDESSAQNLITGIKNGYTGTGTGSGHRLTYTLKMDETSDNYEALTAKDFTTTITYTITSN